MNDLERGGLSMAMLRNQDNTTSNRVIDAGSPFYYHWNPEGTQLVFHRNNARIAIYDIAQSDVSLEFGERSSGLFQAPAWSPTDSRILIALSGSDRTLSNLVILAEDTIQTLIEDVRGFVSFLWSPDGKYIAYRTFTRDGINPIIVVDSRTGEEVSRSNIDGIMAFFWSPDSSKIAYLTFTEQASNTVQLLWSVLDIELDSNVQHRGSA
jgi:Tol biopolymer transport system component